MYLFRLSADIERCSSLKICKLTSSHSPFLADDSLGTDFPSLIVTRVDNFTYNY